MQRYLQDRLNEKYCSQHKYTDHMSSGCILYTAVLLMVFKGEGRPHIQFVSIHLFNIQFKNPEEK